MQNNIIGVNSRIDVIMGNEKAYKALIIDAEDDYIKINLPVYDDEYLMLYRGDKIEINSYTENGQCYNFYCNVISKGKEGNILYYKLTTPYNMTKIQRRDYVRVQVLKDVEYKNLSEVKEKAELLEFKKCVMIDLSGGGVKIKTNERLKKGDHVILRIQFENNKMEIQGEVVRVESTPDKERLCGIMFTNISQVETDRIMKELFEIMRKQRAIR